MTTNPSPAALSSDVVRSYDRLLAQITWLLGERGFDEASLARGVVAAMRGEPIGAPFTTGAQRNVAARLAWLWLWRAPWLLPSMLVSGPRELEVLAAGQGTMVAAVRSIQRLELEPAGDALATRGHRGACARAGSRRRARSPGAASRAVERRAGGSEADVARAIELDPGCGHTYLVLGLVLRAAGGDARRALDDHDRAVALSGDATAFYNRGTFKIGIQDWAGAESDFTAALERNPNDAQALLNRGTVRAMRQDIEGTLADFGRAATAAPDYAPARMKYGLVLCDVGRAREGRTELEAALACAPRDWPHRSEIERVVRSLRA